MMPGFSTMRGNFYIGWAVVIISVWNLLRGRVLYLITQGGPSVT
jgi:hypothetical protein